MARARVRAANVSERTDLEAAARAAAVIETLDEIAESQLNAFAEASYAILTDPLSNPSETPSDQPRADRVRALQQEHAQWFQAWTDRRISVRDVRMALVDY